MTFQPDFAGDPPDYYWSEMGEDELRDELARMLTVPVVRAWTDEDEGPAFAETEDGRTFRFVGDGTTTAFEEVATP